MTALTFVGTSGARARLADLERSDHPLAHIWAAAGPVAAAIQAVEARVNRG